MQCLSQYFDIFHIEVCHLKIIPYQLRPCAIILYHSTTVLSSVYRWKHRWKQIPPWYNILNYFFIFRCNSRQLKFSCTVFHFSSEGKTLTFNVWKYVDTRMPLLQQHHGQSLNCPELSMEPWGLPAFVRVLEPCSDPEIMKRHQTSILGYSLGWN